MYVRITNYKEYILPYTETDIKSANSVMGIPQGRYLTVAPSGDV